VKPVLALTVGDVAGVGPEVVAGALADPRVHAACRPLVVGDAASVGRWCPVHRVDGPEAAAFEPGTADVLQPGDDLVAVPLGRLSAVAGDAAVRYVRAAADLAGSGRVAGIVTAPLNKEAMHLAGHRWPGHTELLADHFGIENFSLVLTSGGLSFFHVTTHVALREACAMVTEARVGAVIDLAHRFGPAFGFDRPAIAVLGLNPHAGEGGVFGREDVDAIAPAVAAAVGRGIDARGPLPADAAVPAALAGRYRSVIAMYHDQGHVVFKSVFGDRGVNITVGLPVVRTSVDHGTAFDIAGQGLARPESMVEAILLAAALAPDWHRISA